MVVSLYNTNDEGSLFDLRWFQVQVDELSYFDQVRCYNRVESYTQILSMGMSHFWAP